METKININAIPDEIGNKFKTINGESLVGEGDITMEYATKIYVDNATYKNKGYFPTLAELQSAFPEGSAGSRAYVGSTYPYSIYLWQNGAWVDSGATGGDESVDLASYYTKSETDTKLATLESEVRIMQGEQYYKPSIISGEYVAYEPMGQIVKDAGMTRTEVLLLDGLDAIGLGSEDKWFTANYCCFYDEAMNPLKMYVFEYGSFAPISDPTRFPIRPKYLIVSASYDNMEGMSIALRYDKSLSLPNLRADVNLLIEQTTTHSLGIDTLQTAVSEHDKQISCLETSSNIMQGKQYYKPSIISGEYVAYEPMGQIVKDAGMTRTSAICLEGVQSVGLGTEDKWFTANYCCFYDEAMNPLEMYVFEYGSFAPISDPTRFPIRPKYLIVSASYDNMEGMTIILRYDISKSLPFLRNRIPDARLSEPKELKLLYLNRWVANNNEHDYLLFYYGGNLSIDGFDYTNEMLVEIFSNSSQGMCDEKSSAFYVHPGYALIANNGKLSFVAEKEDASYDGIVLLANPIINDVDNPREIYGILYELYKKELYNDVDYKLSGDTIHSWLQKSVEDKMNLLASEVDEESMVALVSTDVHGQPYNRVYTPIYGVLNYVCKNFAPRYYIDLGDSIVQWLSVFGNKNQGLSNLRNVASIANIQEKFFVVGNHDYNSNNQTSAPNNLTHLFTDKEVFNSIGRCMNGRVVWGSKEKMYYYRDFEDVKLRIIVLNTQDRIMRFNDAGEMISRDPMTYCGIRQEQMDWFANMALDFSDKTDKSEWTTLVYSHIPLSPSYNQSPQVQNDVCVWDIMEAFKKGSSMTYSYTDTSEDADLSINITKDFSSQGAMNLIGNICGHEHRQSYLKDGVLTYGWDYKGIACRVINCGYPYQNTEYLGITYHQKAWTPNGYSLGVTIFNPSKRLFRITYFGYGEDEIVNY